MWKRFQPSRGLLHDCEIFVNLRIAFVWSSSCWTWCGRATAIHTVKSCVTLSFTVWIWVVCSARIKWLGKKYQRSDIVATKWTDIFHALLGAATAWHVIMWSDRLLGNNYCCCRVACGPAGTAAYLFCSELSTFHCISFRWIDRWIGRVHVFKSKM